MFSPPRNGARTKRLCAFLAVSLLGMLAGCGYSGPSNAVPPAALQGSVHGGHQPVRGSSIQLYAAGTSGNGSSAQALLSEAVQTDDNGNFSIPAAYGCPGPTSQMFVIAHGGNAGVASGGNNSALTLMAALGSCATLSRVGAISINEVTTVGSVWPLAAFMKSSTEIGSAAGDPDFVAAVTNIPEFINLAAGSSPGTSTATSSFTESSKLYSLADLLAGCVDSGGGSPGDNSPCGQLFTLATPAGQSAPSDTTTAAISIAQHPTSNVDAIFNLTASDSAFQPALSSAPTDWALSLTYPVAIPVISLPTGTYGGAQQVTISDATPNSTIYYTTDGTTPSNTSSVYSGPITVGVSTTLEAIAFVQDSQSGVAAATLTITTSLPTQKLVFLQQPTNASINTTIAPAVAVEVEDGNGNLLSTADSPVTLSLTTGSGLVGSLTITPQNGIATFSNLSLSSVGTYTLTATSPAFVSTTSASFVIVAPNTGNPTTAAKVAFLQQPSNAATGTTMSPVTVAIEDSSGNTASGANNPVTLTLSSGSSLGGTLTVAAQNGVATFSTLSVTVAGTYTLLASSPGLTAVVSSPFTIVAPVTQPTPERLTFLQQPSNAVAGATISPAVTVAVQDSSGNTVSSATNLVTLALSSGSGLAGMVTANARNGIATFSSLSVNSAGTYTFSAGSPGLSAAVSSSFTIAAPVTQPLPAKLTFLQQPSNAATGTTISPAITVAVQDSNGNTVTSATNLVTLALSSGNGLGGVLTVNARNGIATFSNVSVNTAGTYTLLSSSPGLTTATSTSFTITAPVTQPSPAKLTFLQQPSNAATGTTISPAVTVAVQDSNGNTVTSASNTVTLALSSGSGLGGTVTSTPQNGIATFSSLSVNAAGTYTLAASSTGLASAVSASFTITAPVTQPSPAKLTFLQQPSNAATGATISPAVTVAVQDSNGNTVTSAINVVTLALSSGSGLGGTVSATPQNGIATFSSLSVNAGGTYTLAASSTGLASAVSTSFTITAPATQPSPAKLAFVQEPSNAVVGAAVSPAVTVAVQDDSGNTVTSATNTVTLSLSSGGGLAGTVTANAQNGIATFNTLSVNAAGTYTLSASSSGLTTGTSSNFTITLPPTSGAIYYLSPNGSDGNNGLSAASPWLTPNHSLNCGDVISAASGSYNAANFNSGKWGTVSCPAGNSVAWLQCATFDTCKIATTSADGMWVDQSYWGVQGWEVNVSNNTDGACFHAGPKSSTIHHIIFANDVANGCMGGGFTAYDRSTSASVDYIVYVGNIAYNGAQGGGECFSGFNIYQPIASDNNAGTHMFVAGNFSWGNMDGNPCAGTAPTDGEGINFDTWDFSQGGGPAYAQQGVIENNIEFLNGGDGIEVENNSAGGANAPIYIKNNTQYGDRRDNNQTFCKGNGEIDLYKASQVSASNNLIYAGFATGCEGDAMYAIAVSTSDATDVIENNFASGVDGNNTFLYESGSLTLGLGNILGINPSFPQTSMPAAPSCAGSANVTSCMATVIADFAPTVSAAKAYGYQQPSATNVYDPLFPLWLCHAGLPAGLVTMGCQ